MLSTEERIHIQLLMQQEIVPAIGCTEPISVALCTAKACQVLQKRPGKIEAFLSANVVKNAMAVGIPGTGMTGDGPDGAGNNGQKIDYFKVIFCIQTKNWNFRRRK